jgi:hypothetical protein
MAFAASDDVRFAGVQDGVDLGHDAFLCVFES